MNQTRSKSNRFPRANEIAKIDYLEQMERRSRVRYILAFLSGITAVIYFMIGLQLLIVIEFGEYQLFGIGGGVLYVFGTLMLLARDERRFAGVGMFLQLALILGYLSNASQREPTFEIWGVVIVVLQLIIMIGLAYLNDIDPRET